MRSNITKEWMYAIRSGRVLIIFASFLFLALSTPLMFKVVLPMILESQLGTASSQEISAMINMGQMDSIQSYIGDVFEIGSIVVAFTLCGVLAQEVRENTLVIPLCSGKRYGEIVGSKLLVFGMILLLVQCTSTMATYLYSGVLFSFEIQFGPIIRSGILQGIYMIFLLCCLLMWGAILERPIPSGFASLATVYGMHFLGNIFSINDYFPSGLLMEANRMTTGSIIGITLTILPTAVLMFIMTGITLSRMKRINWNER